MDFSFTEEQQELQGLARRILEDKVTEELLREVEAAPDRFDRDVYLELGKAGVLGIALPADAGGGGYGIIEQCLVLQEVGRVVAPVPVLPSIVMGAATIAELGTPDQRSQWVPAAATGERILTAAFVEPLNRDPLALTTTAVRDGDAWRLTGVKTRVPSAMIADAVLVPAATDGGVGIFLVEPGTQGMTVTRQPTSNKDSDGHLELDGARVAGDALLGGTTQARAALESALLRTTVGLCALQLGVTEKALSMTAEYTKTRVQFERPIATFQAVGQRTADAYIDVEGIRLTLWQAAWRLSEGLPATTEVEVAKFWAAEGGHRVVHAAVHLHGGMGVDVDYPLHRYYLAAKQIEFSLGGATEQLLRIGQTLATEPA